MLMNKDELRNTWALAKVKWHGHRRSLIVLGIMTIVFFSMTSVSYGGSLLPVMEIKVGVNIFWLVLWLLWMMSHLKSNGDWYKAYPQTHMSRFLSDQMVLYTGVLLYFVISAVLVGFMCWSNWSSLISELRLSTIIAGMFLYLIYVFAFVALVLFLSKLFQRYFIFAVCSGILLFTVVIWQPGMVALVVGFILEEASFTLFFIKMLVIWLLLLFGALWLNKGIKIYSNMWNVGHFAILIILFLTIPFLMYGETTDEGSSSATRIESVPIGRETIELDISSLDLREKSLGWSFRQGVPGAYSVSEYDGNEYDDDYDDEYDDYDDAYHGNIMDVEQSYDSPEGKVIIEYELPVQMVKGENILAKYHSFEAGLNAENDRIEMQYSVNRRDEIVLLRWSDLRMHEPFSSLEHSRLSTGYVHIRFPKSMEEDDF